MAGHLELPSSLKAQQAILLNKLPGWDEPQLEKKLQSLESKQIVVLTNHGSAERRIALERISTIPTLDTKEKTLWLLLRTFISQLANVAINFLSLI